MMKKSVTRWSRPNRAWQDFKEYDERIAHLALARTAIDLDDGVKVNYNKVQTDAGGNTYGVLKKI